MFNFFKKEPERGTLEHGSKAAHYAAKLAQVVPFNYLLGNAKDGTVSYRKYTGVLVEKGKIYILTEDELNSVRMHLAQLRDPGNVQDRVEDKESDWITWDGRVCPVRRDTGIDIKLADGRVVLDTVADSWAWESHEKLKNRIVAYRVVRP